MVRNQGRHGLEEACELGGCGQERDASVRAGFRFVEQANNWFVESPFEESHAVCRIAQAGAGLVGWMYFTPFQSVGLAVPRSIPDNNPD